MQNAMNHSDFVSFLHDLQEICGDKSAEALEIFIALLNTPENNERLRKAFPEVAFPEPSEAKSAFWAVNALTAKGFGMTEIQKLAKRITEEARKRIGHEEVNALLKTIPALGMFVK